MARSQQQESWLLPAGGLLVVISALFGAVLKDKPFERTLSTSGGVRQASESELETHPARLWQDPLRVLDQIQEGQTGIPPSRLRRELFGFEEEDETNWRRASMAVTVLGVAIPGSREEADKEVRRRSRYAVVAGLASRGFVPQSSGHLGILEAFDPGTGNSVRTTFELFIRDPLEVRGSEFRRRRPHLILVLWVDELVLGDEPLRGYADLLGVLLRAPAPGPESDPEPVARTSWLDSFQLALIGPSSSESLYQLAVEAAGTEPDVWNGAPPLTDPGSADLAELGSRSPDERAPVGPTRRTLLSRLSILSHRATVARSLLLRRLRESRSGFEGGLEGFLFDHLGIQFERVLPSDDEVFELLIAELARRGVDLADPGNDQHVVLITELDTFYSRAAALSFESVLLGARASRMGVGETGLLTSVESGDTLLPREVHRVSFSADLDGTLPPTQAGVRASADEGGAELERAYGDNQLDYVRRISAELGVLQRNLIESGRGRIGAIGVLGSSIQDKLVVLQGLRAQFPGALFFTKDLETLFADPAHYEWCSNLLVGSSFGLALDPLLQAQAPPFRDCYQTSTYLATLLALGPVPSPDTGDDPTLTERRRRLLAADAEEEWGRRNDPRWISVDRRVAMPHGGSRVEGQEGTHLADAISPQLFEIARSGAYDITPDAYRRPIHGRRLAELPGLSKVIAILLATVLFGVILVPHSQRLRALFEGTSEGRSRRAGWTLAALNARTGLVLGVLGIVLMFVLIHWSNVDGTGEPFRVMEGISIWPSEFLRAGAVCLAIYSLVSGTLAIRASQHEIGRLYGLPTEPDAQGRTFGALWRQAFESIHADRQPAAGASSEGAAASPPSSSAPQRVARGLLTHLVDALRATRRAAHELAIDRWSQRVARRVAAGAAGRTQGRRSASGAWTAAERKLGVIEIERSWKEYVDLSRTGFRLVRVLPVALLYCAFGYVLSLVFEPSRVPFRGEVSQRVDTVLTLTTRFGVTLLVFWVVDAHRLCAAFVKQISLYFSDWPASFSRSPIGSRRHGNGKDMSDFVDVQVTARITDVIGRQIMPPFLMLAILIVARTTVFDAWTWSPASTLWYSILGGYAILAAVVLRRSAENARRRALRRMRASLTAAYGESDGARANQLQQLIDEVQSIRSGAFASLRDNPVLKALVLPFGGASVVSLIEVLARMGG